MRNKSPAIFTNLPFLNILSYALFPYDPFLPNFRFMLRHIHPNITMWIGFFICKEKELGSGVRSVPQKHDINFYALHISCHPKVPRTGCKWFQRAHTHTHTHSATPPWKLTSSEKPKKNNADL